MANATKTVAPLKQSGLSKEDQIFERLGIELDPNKRYAFELAVVSPERELPAYIVQGQKAIPLSHRKFKPFQNLVLSSQIVWNNSRTNIRYYDGCETIFVSDQPKEKETIDFLIKSTRKRSFQDGHFVCYGDEKMLLAFLFACSWNVESPYRTRTADAIFLPLDHARSVSAEDEKLNEIEKAIQNAKDASDLKMSIHANYLGIPMMDSVTGNEIEPAALRVAYRKRAIENPVEFNKSYGDKTIEIKYLIDKALSSGMIDYKTTNNKATWKGGSVICDISGFKTSEGVASKLIELSQLEEGEEFVLQLKALYN